jgi:cholesterol oxidase
VSTAPVQAAVGDRPGLHFTEKMSGFFSTQVTDGYAKGFAQGRADGSVIEFVLTIDYEDLSAVLKDRAHVARTSGTLIAPELSPHRLTVEHGTFRLIVPDPMHVETWHMFYEMTLRTEDDTRYRFFGFKLLRERSGLYAWHDTSTLFVTIRGDDGSNHGVGIMTIRASDFVRQLLSMHVVGVRDPWRRLGYLARFGRAFMGSLFHIYGGALDEPGRFPKPSDRRPGPPAPNRPLRLPAPKVRWCDGNGRWHPGDEVGPDAWLRLIRYHGKRSTKGPLLLAGGFAMTSGAFTIDTIDMNMAEYFYEHEYDVWLLDYRASIDLPSSETQFSLDDIATKDWPTAVAEVLARTKKEDLQAFGHCVASVTLLMAMLSGTKGIRTAVCSQFTTHVESSTMNRIKAKLHVGDAMGLVGLAHADPNTRFTVPNVVLDLVLRVLPMATEERCGQAICRWINAIYGLTHRHAQLNDATHRAFSHMFGVGNVETLRHLATITRAGQAVDECGHDVYTGHPERLALPILFLQGDRNYIFRPPGSERAIRWLRRNNGKREYERRILPGYAHLDAIVGRNAAQDVYRHMREYLDRH